MQLENYIEDVGRVLWQWSTWAGAAGVLFLVACFVFGFMEHMASEKRQKTKKQPEAPPKPDEPFLIHVPEIEKRMRGER